MSSLLSNPLKSIIFVFHWQLRMKTKEEIFIEQINLKRREAYHELFRRFYRSLVIFALKYIDEQGEAEDIVQELFVSVWEKEEKFMSYASFRVFRIAVLFVLVFPLWKGWTIHQNFKSI